MSATGWKNLKADPVRYAAYLARRRHMKANDPEQRAVQRSADKRRWADKERRAAQIEWQRVHRYGLPKAERPEPDTCELCGNPPKGGKGLCLDHCHATGKFRGWLCHGCNLALGILGDSLAGVARATNYLQKATS